MTVTAANKNCPRCGAPLNAGAVEGFCQSCLAAVAFGAADEVPPGADQKTSSRRLGDYQLLEEIGRGGMGVVYRARQLGLERDVAIKVLRHGPFSAPEEVARFRREAAAAAGLHHANIVAIHEVGEADGHLFFSMELVEGRTLAELTRDGPLESERAARYALAIARAISAAHDRHILHRDLKPPNVIIDAADQPRVTDFGLAKRLDAPDATTTRDIMGSPGYLPPEQADPARGAFSFASDVYSLGALLYHLITGRPPFAAATVTATIAQVLHNEPVPPRRLNSTVPRDLETICLKCLRKEPARRYDSAKNLAADLQAFLEHRPIAARPASALERIALWHRRKPAQAILSGSVLLAVLAGLIGVGWQWRRAEHEAVIARLNAYAADMSAAGAAWREGDWGLARQLLSRYTNGPAAGQRGFEWFLLWRETRGTAERSWQAHGAGVRQISFTPDGRSLLTQGREALALWDVGVGERRWISPLVGGPGSAFVIEPDGATITTTGSNCFRRLSLESAATLGEHPFASARPFHQVFFGGGAYFAADDVMAVSWKPNATNFEKLEACHAPAALSPDGTIFAACGSAGIWLWSATTAQWLGELDDQDAGAAHAAPALAFSPDGRMLALGTRSGLVKVWNWRERETLALLTNSPGQIVFSVCFSPDGQWLFTGSGDQAIRRWRTNDWTQATPLRGHGNEVWSLAFSPDHRRLASGDKDGVIKFWQMDAEVETHRFVVPSGFIDWTFISAEEQISFATAPGGIRWVRQPYHSTNTSAAGFLPGCEKFWDSPRARFLVTRNTNAVLELRELGRDRVLSTFKPSEREVISWIQFSADECTAIAGTGEDTVTWLSVPGLRPFQRLKLPAPFYYADKDRLVTHAAGEPFGLDLWRRADGAFIARLQGHRLGVWPATGSPDGRWLASPSEDGTVRVWSLADGRLHHVFRAQRQGVFVCDFSPDAGTLAAGGQDGTVTLWHLPTGRFITTLDAHEPGHQIHWLRFVEDGQALNAYLGDKINHVWRAPRNSP
ncbi:MAG: protein kinase [Verrucomicrobia bacterium]|nr:protein kinase [Verrucomicrobiota bacterium]